MQKRRVGEFEVSAIGLGCMSLSHAYGPPPPREQAEQVLLGALDAGYTFFDTAAVYGLGHNETLVGEVLGPHRDKIVLCSKAGLSRGTQRELNGHPDVLKETCELSLKLLKTEVIDLYYLHRWDRRVPIEDSVGALADLVKAGKIRSIGLSEVSAPTLRRAHETHPIAALQTEYSPWTRNPEIAVLQACRELGASFVAFSPLARGFLCDAVHDAAQLAEKDIRRPMPRFAPDNLQRNLQLLPAYKKIAARAYCTPAQLALAWLLHQGEDILPVPGTTSVAHLRENLGAADVRLSAELLAELDALINQRTVAGDRYTDQANREVDTEKF